MKGMILAAGKGTRLAPITNDLPKALISLGGKTLLENAILTLKAYGIRQIIVNVHHLGEMVIAYLEKHSFVGMEIEISDEREKLLDTGGAIKKASWFFEGGKEVLVYNVDIISRLNFDLLTDHHRNNSNRVTLVVRDRETNRKLLFDETGKLTGWREASGNRTIWVNGSMGNPIELAFSGIHVLDTELIEQMQPGDQFPLIPEYLALAKTNRIGYYLDMNPVWFDTGKPEDLKNAGEWLENS